MIFLAVNWSHVWMVTLLGFGLVFILLVFLVAVLKLFGVIMQPRAAKAKVEPIKANNKEQKTQVVATEGDSDATKAAIAMALHLYYADVHDNESLVLTLKQRRTAWNSKIYGMNNLVK